MTSKHKKQAQSKPHQNRNAKEEKKKEIQRKIRKKDTFIKRKWEEKETQNKTGASAGEGNP